MKTNRWLLILSVLVLALALAAVACGDDDGDGNGGDTPAPAATTPAGGETPMETPAMTPGAGSTVEVNLTEWLVSPDPASVPAGTVTFNVHNIGGEEHEFVVVRTDLAIEELPTLEDGSFDESGEGVTVVDEIEEMPPLEGEGTLTLDLEAGHYVLLCNVVEEEMAMTPEATPEEPHIHFAEGMHTDFEVTS
jgi:hypothetical protein